MNLSRIFKRNRRKNDAWWHDILVLLTACSAYVVIASLGIGQESSYFDEGFTSYLARFSPLDIAHYTALDVHPPLYYIALHYWQALFGIDVFNLRFMSVAWGVIAIIFGFLLVRRLFGRAAAASSLVFMILSPLFIRYSEAMRMYTMAITIVVAATYVLVLLATNATRHKRLLWITYAVLVTAGMWTNYFTAFVWLAHLIWVVWEWKGGRVNLVKHWLLAIGLAVVLYLPWLPWLLLRFSDVQSTGFWIKPIAVDTLASTITTATVYTGSAQTTNWLAVAVCIYVALTGVVIAWSYRAFNAKQQALFRLLIICAVIPILALILLSLPPFRSSFVYRYVLNGVFMATLVIGIAYATIQFKHRPVLKKIGLYSFAIVILGLGVFNAKQAGNRSLDTGVKNMVAQAITKINATSVPGEPIISRSPYTYYTASLYETTKRPIYYTFTSSLNKVGSTHMLYDHPEKRGIKDMVAFGNHHKRLWMLAEDRYGAMNPPSTHWKRSQSFVLYDPVTHVPTVYASEYVKR
jgi:mannosyltransferase